MHTVGDSQTSLHELYIRNQHVVIMNVRYPHEITTPNPLILMILKNIYVQERILLILCNNNI